MDKTFKITKPSPNRVDLELDGKLDADDMRTALDQLTELSADVENGKMFYRIHNFQFPTFGAIAIEVSRLPGLFKLITKFDRVAVAADEDWIRKASELEGKLFPGLDIQSFPLGEEATAEAWLESPSGT